MHERIEQMLQEHLGKEFRVTAHEGGASINVVDEENPFCDFCSDRPAPHVMRAEYIKMADMTIGTSVSTDNWAACDTCKRLIDTGDRSALLSHSVRRFRVAYPNLGLADVRHLIAVAHRAYFKARRRA